MAESHNLGIKGEDLAAEHLKKSGYKILFRNWKWGKNEIDIIAEKDDTVVFVEVKTRTDEFLGGRCLCNLHRKTEVNHLCSRGLHTKIQRG